MTGILKYIAIILAIQVCVLTVFNRIYINENKKLSQEIEALQVINEANIRAIATLKRASDTAETVITVWSAIRDNLTERQVNTLSAVQKEIKDNEDSRAWSNELVPDNFILLLQQNGNSD